jgi:hypothetical protein
MFALPSRDPERSALMRELGIPEELRECFFSDYTLFAGTKAGEATNVQAPDSRYRRVGDGLFVPVMTLARLPIVFPFAVDKTEHPLARQFWRVRTYVLGHPPGLYIETRWRPDWPHAESWACGLSTDPTREQWSDLLEAARIASHDVSRRGVSATYDSRQQFVDGIHEAARGLMADLRRPVITLEMLLGKMPIGRSAFFEAQRTFDVHWRQEVRAVGGQVKR